MQSASSAGHIAHVSLGKQRCEVEMLALYTLSLKQAKEMSLNISALRPGSNAPPEEAFSQLCSLLGGGEPAVFVKISRMMEQIISKFPLPQSDTKAPWDAVCGPGPRSSTRSPSWSWRKSKVGRFL